MFWQRGERRMVRTLERLRDRLDLSKESDAVLTELADWLAQAHAERAEELSHGDLLRSLLSDANADKDSVLKEVQDSLAAMEAFAVTLVEKLDAFRSTLSDEQKSLLANELGARGWSAHSWRARHRRRRLRHRQRAA